MFDWITGFVEGVGAIGVALLMFLENVFPPIPSELIMPLAGFTAAGSGFGRLAVMIAAGSVGSLAGALLWYWIGRRVGADRLKHLAARHGRWLTITPEDIDRSNDWFDRHGGSVVLLGRLVPTIRTFISVPAGVARMPLPQFLAFSAVGTIVWTALLAVAGYLLQSQYDRVSAWLNPVSTGVVVALVAYYLWRVATWSPKPPPEQETARREGGP